MTRSEAIQEIYGQFMGHEVAEPHTRAKYLVSHCTMNEPQKWEFSNGKSVTVRHLGDEEYEVWWTTGGLWAHIEESYHPSKILLLL